MTCFQALKGLTLSNKLLPMLLFWLLRLLVLLLLLLFAAVMFAHVDSPGTSQGSVPKALLHSFTLDVDSLSIAEQSLNLCCFQVIYFRCRLTEYVSRVVLVLT